MITGVESFTTEPMMRFTSTNQLSAMKEPHHCFDDETTTSRREFFQQLAATTLATAVATIENPTAVNAASDDNTSGSLSVPFFPQFNTVDDVPSDYFDSHKSIYAFVERIIDGDTIRVRHVPFYGIRRKTPQPLQQRGIASDTLSIRVYGVDTPEIGKNKRQTSQPYGEEAKQFTTNLVYHKMVKITFLRKDQYGRAVAGVETVGGGLLRWLPGFGPKDLSMELATAGLAELYTGGGAEYNVSLRSGTVEMLFTLFVCCSPVSFFLVSGQPSGIGQTNCLGTTQKARHVGLG